MKIYKSFVVFVLSITLFSINYAQEEKTYGNIVLEQANQAEKIILEQKKIIGQNFGDFNNISELLYDRISYEDTQDSMILAMKMTGWTLNLVENNMKEITGITLFLITAILCRK